MMGAMRLELITCTWLDLDTLFGAGENSAYNDMSICGLEDHRQRRVHF